MLEVYSLLFCAVALYIGLGGVRQFLKNRKREYALVYGKMIDQQKETHTSRGKIFVGFTPIFEYYFNGQTYRGKHIISSSKYSKGLEIVPASKYEVGTEVELRVFLDNPSEAVINTESNVKFSLVMGAMATVVGVVLVGTAIYLFMS